MIYLHLVHKSGKRVMLRVQKKDYVGKLLKSNEFIFRRDLERCSFRKKTCKLMELYMSKLMFTENLNGPYGPYEHFLKDVSPNHEHTNQVFVKHSIFGK